jgi:hypothetical protein
MIVTSWEETVRTQKCAGVKDMSEPEEIENRLKAMKPGEAVAFLAGGPEAQAVFLMRERSAVIKYFGETGVAVRAARFTFGHVMVAAIAFRLGRTVPMVYGVLLDYCRRDMPEIFHALDHQEYIPLYFYGDNGRRDRTFIAMNHVQTFFSDTAAAVRAMPQWDADDFPAAAAKLTGCCPVPGDLWEAMQDGRRRDFPEGSRLAVFMNTS